MATTTDQVNDDIAIPTSWSKPYPPTNRDGDVAEHDKPFFYYGHLDAASICELRKFSLPKKYEQYQSKGKGSQKFKLNCTKMAISGFTTVSKEQAYIHIVKSFKQNIIRYVCVASDTNVNESMARLNIQIIFHVKKSVYTRFMDKLPGSQWEYQVTKWADAWNEYIKKGLSFIEKGFFYGSMDNGAKKQWSKQIVLETSDTISNELASEAFALATMNSYDAMNHLIKRAPKRCLTNLKGLDSNLEYFRKKTCFHEQFKQAEIKEFCWPDSFPHCTEKLKNAMNEWLWKNFREGDRRQCLFLIGPTGTGKTSFALSLPGFANHYRGHWSIDRWHNDANYMVLDDIPWDKFEERGFPSPQDLITDQKFLSVNTKYGPITTINTSMPAIVLMNPHHATKLLRLFDKDNKDPMAYFWKERSYLYVMEKNEYFYKPQLKQPSEEQIIYTVDEMPLFQEARRRWHDAQQTKQADTICELDLPDGQSDISSEQSEEYPLDD